MQCIITQANIDIQYAETMAFPTPIIFYSTGGFPPFIPDGETPTNTNEPYMDWLEFTLGQEMIPQTISTSYGDNEETVPPDYARSICNMFAQLGAMGTTVIFSSGDGGVSGGVPTDNCVNFIPTFPAPCEVYLSYNKGMRFTRFRLQGPYVTTVGATTQVHPEVVANFSSGGFSNHFVQPSYQKRYFVIPSIHW